MKPEANKPSHILAILTACLIFLILSASPASSEETYKFERMWPALQQPWYFTNPNDVAIDKKGFVYIVNFWKGHIQKFTSEGQFIGKWGDYGTGDGQFSYPYGIALDPDNFLYVADTYNHRIQKFDPQGKFIRKWGIQGDGDSQFEHPYRIALDADGFVYVADSGNHRIQKFTSEGDFITKWGREGDGDGQFDNPSGIALDADGFVYVADTYNSRIQKFDSEGAFIAKWGSYGTQDGQFERPYGITLDGDGFVYVADTHNYRIQKFASDGQFIVKWGSMGNGEGEFERPRGITSDAGNFIYVADTYNHGLQKFTTEGQFMARWGSKGSGDGQFDTPSGIASDAENFVYVTDTYNHRVQKFTREGQLVVQWGNRGNGDGQFESPSGVTSDADGFVYVADTDNHRIQKFASEGQFVAKWGSQGSEDGQFRRPRGLVAWDGYGIVSDGCGFIYVADSLNHRIQKFTKEGQFVAKWGSQGSGEGNFDRPGGITSDIDGFIYVADTYNSRIQKFAWDGQFIVEWGILGSGNGQFKRPSGIAWDTEGFVYIADSINCRIQKFTSDGQFMTKFGISVSDPGMFNSPLSLLCMDEKLYITDTHNNRIQVISPGIPTDTRMKAIIVAGGGPYPGNTLWNATQMSANFAYRALTYQGFTKETIYYLTSDTDLDLDSNGEPDDVDGDVTAANLEHAITEWAADADSLVIYLTDHGGTNVFRMNGSELLLASPLDSWLDTLQASVPEVIVVYDACYAGSFVSTLAHTGRIVIASASPDEPAHFISQGTVSFSNYFWSHIFNGDDIRDAFNFASSAIGEFQTPLMDANANGTGSEPDDIESVRNLYIGNGTRIQAQAPEVAEISEDQTLSDTNAALLYASGLTDKDGISRVWAVIQPPNYNQGVSGKSVQELPSADLLPKKDTPGRYENTYDGFSIQGVYKIAIYARDGAGNTMVPQLTTVTAANPMKRRAIIVAGGSQSDKIWPAIEKNTALVYEALNFQGYTDEQDDDAVYLMASASIPGVTGTSVLPTLSNMRYAIEDWASHQTWDMVIYLIGNHQNGAFRMNPEESLTSGDLDAWLDHLQQTLPGKVTVVYDGCRSAEFLSSLTPPPGKDRILISSAGPDQSASFVARGTLSFSRFFWKSVIDGANARDAFVNAKRAVRYLGRRFGAYQEPHLDDNGNGIGNESDDGRIAQKHSIGTGIMLASDDPLIGAVSPAQMLNSEPSATIWAENVTTTRGIENVLAVIIPPESDHDLSSDPITELATVSMEPVGGGRYEGIHNGFCKAGTYQIVIYATDDKGGISLPVETQIEQIATPEWGTCGPHVSAAIDGPAVLTVYDPENRACGRHGCEIPDADFEISGDGGQTVFLNKPAQGNYRFVLNTAESGESLLTISACQGEEILSQETKTVCIEAHQVLKSAVSVSSELTFIFSDPEIPVTSEGKPLSYDFDGTGKIDEKDIEKVSSRWNIEEGDPEYDPIYDLDDDGYIGIIDIMQVVNSM